MATIVLQEMAGRLGVVSRQGLGEALRQTFRNTALRILVIVLVVAAIAFGNAAFQTGNITGAAIALEAITGISPAVWAIVVGIGSFLLLASGAYKLIERVLVVLVIVMSVVFLLTAVVARPNLGSILSGMFVPRVPSGSLLTIVALIGTTVVPYNLFLHASSVQEKWSERVRTRQAIAESRFDTFVSILLGGLITLAVVSTAAAAFFEQGTKIEDASTMAQQLEPLLGPAAKYFFALGFLASGLTSAVTAPLAAAYATAGALGWEQNLKSGKFRAVWAIILVIGTILAAAGQKPVQAIVFAQAANGILLPVVAVFLLIVMNQTNLLREFKNGTFENVLGGLVVLIAAALGMFQLVKALGVV